MHIARLRELNAEFLDFAHAQLRRSLTLALDQHAYREVFGRPLPEGRLAREPVDGMSCPMN